MSPASMAKLRHPSDIEEGHCFDVDHLNDGRRRAVLVRDSPRLSRLPYVRGTRPAVHFPAGRRGLSDPIRCRDPVGRRISGNAGEMWRRRAASPPRRRPVLPSPPASTRRYVVRLSRQTRRRRRSRRREDRHPLSTGVERAASKSAVSAITGGRTKYCKTDLETMLSANVCRCRATCTSTSSSAPTSVPPAFALLRITERRHIRNKRS